MFNVLHSSAGAGKTHALVKRFLELALEKPEPDAYARILALTFTNKAAAEMRDRVIAYLQALASSEPLDGARSDVRDAVLRRAGITEDQLQRRAKAMLTHMLHHWPQLAISTIDSFTRRIVMPFTRDLGLDPELRMTTEEEYYRSKAVDLLLEEAGSDAALTDLLVATCEQLLEEERAWRPDKPLLELSEQLAKENALEHLAALQDMDSARFIAIHDRLRQRAHAFRARMRALGAKACDAIDRAGLAPTDLAYGKNGFLSYFRKLRDFDDTIDVNNNAEKVRTSGRWYSASASPDAIRAIEGIVPVLQAVMDEVEGLRGSELRDHIVRVAMLRELMATAALNSIDRRLEALKREEGVSFFSDLTRKVMAIVQDEPAPFLYERLGEKYDHFLIDEFQDTSLKQWHALLPLVVNALATGGTVLLVGDAKQAIYRWRNGEARQFVRFPDLFGEERLVHGEAFGAALRRAYEPVDALASNRRSARNIITFNNDLTERLKAGGDNETLAIYDRHGQEAMGAEGGYVEVTCFDSGRDHDPDAPWALMVKAVEDCLADGFRPGDIAVLVRTKKQGALASAHLSAKGWNVVSPAGLTLGGDSAACTVMALLAWFHRPDDEHAAQAAQAIATLRSNGSEVDPFAGGAEPRDLLRRWRAEHPLIGARSPLVSLVCRIAEALHCDPASNMFIMALVNEAQSFSKAEGDDLGGFLEYWERAGQGRPVGGTPGAEAVQVMTVHKAKGLEFPVVILPEAGKRSRGGKGERIWIKPEKHLEGPESALVKMVKPITGLDVPEIVEESALAALDELDVLYVAITRPKQRLYISVSGGGNDTLPQALREHLDLKPGDTWTVGDREAHVPKEEAAARASFQLRVPVHRGERELAIRREAPDAWDPADPDPYRSFGRAVHAVLARTRTVEDLPEALAKEQQAWGLQPTVAEAIGSRLMALLKTPGLRSFFRDGLDVYTESTLIDAEGRAARPDRIVRDGNMRRVLDIKTGAPSEEHMDQVRRYMHLLRTVEEGAVEGYLLYLRTGELIPVSP